MRSIHRSPTTECVGNIIRMVRFGTGNQPWPLLVSDRLCLSMATTVLSMEESPVPKPPDRSCTLYFQYSSPCFQSGNKLTGQPQLPDHIHVQGK